MKTKILYIAPFILAFIIVTAGIIYLNSAYNNIFKFDFTPKSNLSAQNDSSKINLSDSLGTKNIVSQNLGLLDSLKTDSLKLITYHDSTETDSIFKFKKETPEPNNTVQTGYSSEINKPIIKSTAGSTNIKGDSIKVSSPSQTSFQNKEQRDTSYVSWLKNVTSIYEAMEPKKAAKIIQNYSDNIARDILYTMKKKNAAKVVAELNPEVANRIFRFE